MASFPADRSHPNIRTTLASFWFFVQPTIQKHYTIPTKPKKSLTYTTTT